MGIHIRLAGEEIGPFSESQVRQYLGEGLVSSSDLAILDGTQNWQTVETVLSNLPPPVDSTPVFSDPAPPDGATPEPLSSMQNDSPNTLEPETTSTADTDATDSSSSETTKPKLNKIVLQPVAPLDRMATPVKRPKTGKTALTLEPLRPTTALPPVVGFVPKERNATKALPKLGQLALNHVPGKIETSPASAPPTPQVVSPATSVPFQPPPLSSAPGPKETGETEKTWFPHVFRGIVYACCALALVLVGLIVFALHLMTAHPKAPSIPVVLPSSPVEKPVANTTPKTSEDFGTRGLIRYAASDLDGALADYDKALELDPANHQACYHRALARQAKGDLAGALADYNAVLGADPSNAVAYRNRAYVKQTQGDTDGALADYHESVVLDPKSPVAYYNVGLIKVKQGDLDGAITAYNYALELDPKMAIAYYNRGNAKNSEGDTDGAIADYTQAIGQDPKIALAYCNRGFARQTKGDTDGALADYTAALALSPNMGIVYYNRCLIRVQQGDLNGAIDDSSRAIDLNAKPGPAYCNRGLAQMGKGNLTEALADLRKFCELAPTDSGTDWARLYLWVIATRQNPKGTADQDLSTALQNEWNSPPEEFASKIANFLLGHIHEDDLIANAASPDASREPEQYCKAWYFAGIKRLFAGDTKTAVTYFQKSIATNQKEFCEHIFAQTELATLGQNAAATPKASTAP